MQQRGICDAVSTVVHPPHFCLLKSRIKIPETLRYSEVWGDSSIRLSSSRETNTSHNAEGVARVPIRPHIGIDCPRFYVTKTPDWQKSHRSQKLTSLGIVTASLKPLDTIVLWCWQGFRGSILQYKHPWLSSRLSASCTPALECPQSFAFPRRCSRQCPDCRI